MTLLKKLPISYKGELNDVKLINFSVALEEVAPFVPDGIKVLDYKGRAIISMVNVRLKRMRPSFLPKWASFSYQHVAFRLLVDDSNLNGGKTKGIYFLKSFTNKPFIPFIGNLLSRYRLSKAEIHDVYGFDLWKGKKFLHYNLNEKQFEGSESLKTLIQSVDRAYAIDNKKLYRTLIQRERWPIEWVNCISFKTNFFNSAEFMGAFCVNEVIDYRWLPAKKVLDLF